MEEESMEEEGGGGEAMMDDQNHNNWGAGGYGRLLLGERPLPARPAGPEQNGAGLRGCEPGAAAGRAGAAGAIAAINISASTSKFLMNVITIEDYKSTYWPKLDSAIDQLLTQSPGDYIPISYEQIYSCVYKCVCQQHSEQMYSDLIKKITNHLERVSKELQASPPDLYIERFNVALGQYMGALQSIVPLFIYMNKFYIETKLNRDLKDDLIKLFTEHVAEKHIYNLMQPGSWHFYLKLCSGRTGSTFQVHLICEKIPAPLQKERGRSQKSRKRGAEARRAQREGEKPEEQCSPDLVLGV